MSRLVRGEFLSLREREFVDAARVAGASDARIMFRHILPNAVGVIIVNATLLMAAAILIETALSFLGYGVQAPDTSLGKIISENQSAFATRPWLFWWPGVFIIAIALCINFIGDGLRDAFDPRQRRMPSDRAFAKSKVVKDPTALQSVESAGDLNRAATEVTGRGQGYQPGGTGRSIRASTARRRTTTARRRSGMTRDAARAPALARYSTIPSTVATASAPMTMIVAQCQSRRTEPGSTPESSAPLSRRSSQWLRITNATAPLGVSSRSPGRMAPPWSFAASLASLLGPTCAA